jgi:hypothetical protein
MKKTRLVIIFESETKSGYGVIKEFCRERE